MKEEEYLVNLDVNIIKASMNAANIDYKFIDTEVLNKKEGFLKTCLNKKVMPKEEYILLCEFFKVLCTTFSSDGKYVFSKTHKDNKTKVTHVLKSNKLNVVNHDKENKVSRRRKNQINDNIVVFDPAELKDKIKTTKINCTKISAKYGKSASYINSCLYTGKMDKSVYNDLINEIETTLKQPDDYLEYKKKMVLLIKKSGKTMYSLSTECGMNKSYISYCLNNNRQINDKVEAYIIKCANDTNNKYSIKCTKDADNNKKVNNKSIETLKNVDNKISNTQHKNDTVSHSETNKVQINEVIPINVNLTKVEINNKKYVLIKESDFNNLKNVLNLSNNIIEHLCNN